MTVETEAPKQTIDFSKLKLERGTTPENIEEKCFKLCQQYLGGVWLNLSLEEVEVKRLSGGLTNQLYYCTINEQKQRSEAKEPQEVAIRLYQEKHFNNEDNDANKRLTDTIIALLVSLNGLGPKIYGLFEGGQIQKYYKHKCFRSDEQKDPKLVDEVARRLARIHNMDVPIKRTGNWLFHYFDDNYKVANERFDFKELIEESKSQTLKTCDVGEELEWLKKAVLDCNSPHIFTHVDFRGSNIMVTESDGIVLCDFEYSCYGYRGFDFGTIFSEWGRVWGKWEQPHIYPSDETIKPFIDSYMDESTKLKGNQFTEDKMNSFESLLKEVKLFSLVGYMWIMVFMMKMNDSIIPDLPFNKLESMVLCGMCGTDFRSSNIMVTESDGIVFCDFEYSCYGYRSFDFGTLFSDWGRVWGKWDEYEYPSDEIIKPFIDSYINESTKLKRKQFTEDKRNSFESLLKEVKVFSLASYMWIIMFVYKLNETIMTDMVFDKLDSMVVLIKYFIQNDKTLILLSFLNLEPLYTSKDSIKIITNINNS